MNKHMGDGPARYFSTTIHEFTQSLGKDNFFLVGEITGNRAFEVVETTGLNAALGIGNVQAHLWNVPKGFANPSEYFDLFRNATYLKRDTQAWFRSRVVTMTDDHDQVWRGGMDKARFSSDKLGKQLVGAAVAFNLCTAGIPCIYYGTEQAFDGTGDNDRYIREAMFGGAFGPFRSKDRHCFNEKNPVYESAAKVAELRKKHLALRRGRQYLRDISGDGFHFDAPHVIGGRMLSVVPWSRICADEEILCAINTDTEHASQAWVTVDNDMHVAGDVLKRIYPTDGDVNSAEVKVEARNGKAVYLSVPPGGFVMYK
jgi:glycosidase